MVELKQIFTYLMLGLAICLSFIGIVTWITVGTTMDDWYFVIMEMWIIITYWDVLF